MAMTSRKRRAHERDEADGDRGLPPGSSFFEAHFGATLDPTRARRIQESTSSSDASRIALVGLGRARFEKRESEVDFDVDGRVPLEGLHYPAKLVDNFAVANGAAPSDSQRSLLNVIARYIDLCTVASSDDHLVPYCVHVLNHIIQTRNLVIGNKQMLESLREKGTLREADVERARDQGFARPKVLILCPMKKDAFRVIETLRTLIFGDSAKPFVTNSQRFHDEFADNGFRISDKRVVEDEYRELMAGNVDDCFRLGVGVAKKSLKLYTSFDESDIIVASPLGLRMVVGEESEAAHETDFLASIEILVVDKADIILMQNWEHLLHIIDSLHCPPEKLSVDVSRIRHWSLSQQAKLYRQTVLFSSVRLAECESLFATKCRNFAGVVTVCPPSAGFLDRVEVPLCQELHRIEAGSAVGQSDERFTFFKEKVLPKCESGTLIFIPSYFDFVRVRNLLKRENESFVQLQEYAKEGKVAKARALFFRGERRLMLMTERFYFFRRYQIKAIKSVVFYQAPSFPQFYHQIVNMISCSDRVLCRLYYTKFDALRMKNIFGDAIYSKISASPKAVHALLSKE